MRTLPDIIACILQPLDNFTTKTWNLLTGANDLTPPYQDPHFLRYLLVHALEALPAFVPVNFRGPPQPRSLQLEFDFDSPLNTMTLPPRASSQVPTTHVLKSVLVALPLACVTYLAAHWEATIVKSDKGSPTVLPRMLILHSALPTRRSCTLPNALSWPSHY